MPLPKITVISPSYNQAQYLERTITSVLNQDYPNLEYIVFDGGSTDASVDIIRRYADRIAYWKSEKDRGQSHAINKGFEKSTGDILCWLNSDDSFTPGTLNFVGEFFASHPEVDVLCGDVHTLDPDGTITGTFKGSYTGRNSLVSYWRGYHMHQPSTFWRRRVYEKLGNVNETLHLTMDFDYWLRMSRHYKIQSVDRVLSGATIHAAAKTNSYNDYKIAQLRTVVRLYGSPFSLRDWDVRPMVYRHLLGIVIQKILGRGSFYG